MNSLKIKFLYGKEFWETLECLIKEAEERVIIVSAFQGEKTYNWVRGLVPNDIFFLNICRSDNKKYIGGKRVKYIPEDTFVIKSRLFHGKIYLIDNMIIIGSQNLYNISFENSRNKNCKEGEFSVLFTFDKFTSSLVLYQALLKIIEYEKVNAEPVNDNFLNFYENGCPFCGDSDIPDLLSLHTCPGYSMGDYITDEECSSFGDEGSCKYCIAENIDYIGESYCCNSCGLGITEKTKNLIYHAINPVTDNKVKYRQAREYLRLFNFFSRGGDAKSIFESLDFVGEVYQVSLERNEYELIEIAEVERLLKEQVRTLMYKQESTH